MERVGKIWLLIALLTAFVSINFSQSAANAALERQRARQIELDLEQRRARMRQLESVHQPVISRPKIRPGTDNEAVKSMEDWIRQMRIVAPEDLRSFHDFLKTKNTGIFKLFPDFDCTVKDVIQVDGPCENFVPYASDYSFRKKGYSSELFHEIRFYHDYIVSDGFFSQGIMVSMGDTPIEKVTSQDPTISYLYKYRTAATLSDAKAIASELRRGIDWDGNRYASRLTATENTTFALRVVQYSGNSGARDLVKKVTYDGPNSYRGFTETEKRFYYASGDERKDITLVFRIVRKDPDGAMTIIWKELQKNKAPDVEFRKGDPLSDFKPDQ